MAKTSARTDADALQRAVAIQCRDPQQAARIEIQVREEGWRRAAEDAAHSCQIAALRLRPWQWVWTPCRVNVNDIDATGYEHRGVGRAAQLLRQLLAAGLSRFEPDPLGALERATGEPAPVFEKETPAKSEGKVAGDRPLH